MSRFLDLDEEPVRSRLTLRDYQQEWVADFREERKTYSRLLKVAATGTGKTTFFAAVAAEEWDRGGRTLILENRDKLVRQTAKRIATETGLDVGVEMAGDHASPFDPVVVASVQSLARENRLTGFADNHFSLVVPDESHHALANSWQKVLNYFHYGAGSLVENWEAPIDGTYEPKCTVLGVTATPELGDKQSLGEFYQRLVGGKAYDYLQAVSDGWLVPPVTRNIPLKIDIRGLRTGRTPNGSDFKPGDLSERLVPVLEALAQQIKAEASDRKGIVFVPSIECARLLAAALCRIGLNGIFVSGECLDVDEKTEVFVQSGAGTFLVNACLYVEGADFPDVSCVVPARATKSKGFYKQQIGRGTRVLPGTVDGLPTPAERRAAIAASAKPNLLILDPLWISDRIDLCDAYDLFTDKPEVKEKMKAAGPPSEDAAREAERDFIKALEKEAKKHARKQARTIDPLAWALTIGDDAIAHYVPEAAWEMRPPSAGQIEFFTKNKIDHAKIKCAGLASKIIGRYMARLNMGLATADQLSFMKQLGFSEQQTATMTKAEASAAIDARLKR
jgi:superfamily II DNA or RNA helicase